MSIKLSATHLVLLGVDRDRHTATLAIGRLIVDFGERRHDTIGARVPQRRAFLRRATRNAPHLTVRVNKQQRFVVGRRERSNLSQTRSLPFVCERSGARLQMLTCSQRRHEMAENSQGGRSD